MSIFDFFRKKKPASFPHIPNKTEQIEKRISQELSELLPVYAQIYTTITDDDICIIIIENCATADVNFDAIGSKLLKYSSEHSVKMNWNYDDPKGEYVRIIFNIKSFSPEGSSNISISTPPQFPLPYNIQIVK